MAAGRRVVVAGAGWAGLAAAVELARRGAAVTVLEAARQAGGRARCAPFGELKVDNGQHLLIGAFRSLLGLLEILGIDESAALARHPLTLRLREAGRPDRRLRAAPLPAPLHLAAALLRAEGFGLDERLRLAAFTARLQRAPGSDCTALAWLLARRQPPPLIRALWEPLCVAALNTPLERASAVLFRRVLGEVFHGPRRHSDLLIPRTDLGSLLPRPAVAFVERHGGRVALGHRVEALTVAEGRVTGVESDHGPIAADAVVVATPPWVARRLLAPHPALAGIAAGIGRLEYQPIATVYLRYPEAVRLEEPMVGIVGGLGQWIFDRREAGQPGVMAVVISAAAEQMAAAGEELTARVAAELAALYPHWPAALEGRAIREKRATFAALPGLDDARPGAATPLAGLWLAGDYTATGLPATLEGAVRSGIEAARGARGVGDAPPPQSSGGGASTSREPLACTGPTTPARSIASTRRAARL